MRSSSARLLHTSVRVSDLTFPASGILVPRTRAIFIHIDNLISFAKRDRDGRVDGYLAGYLPDEVVLLFFRKGELINAASIGPHGRAVTSVAEGLRRIKSDPERSECCYAEASQEQLNWMFSACSGPAKLRFVDSREPEQVFPALASEDFSGVLELISQGRVNYLKFESGRFVRGYLCDRPAGGSVVKYMESLFALRPDGSPPSIAGSLLPDQGEIPAQAHGTLVKVYRELFNRISLAIVAELPSDGRRKGERASAAVQAVHPVFTVLTSATSEDEPSSPISADGLTASFADWTSRVLQEVELVSPGSAERLIRDATRDQRFVLQAAGFYEKLPWQIRW